MTITRGIALGVFIVLVTHSARAEMMPVRRVVEPFRRYCMGPATWDELAKCFVAKVPKPNTPQIKPPPTTNTRLVRYNNQDWLFARFTAERWTMVRTLPPTPYSFTSDVDVPMGKTKKARRILYTQRSLNTQAIETVTENVALVCPLEANYCQTLVYGCTFLSHGRAIETFVGNVVVDENGARVEGDHSQSGNRCQGS